MLFNNQGYSDDITTNLPDMFIYSLDEGFINGDINHINLKGENLIDTLKDLGIIKESYGFVEYNYGSYEHVRFDMDKIREYDPEGLKEFLDKNNINQDINIKI